MRHVSNFGLSKQEIDYLRRTMPTCDPAFFDWLATVDCSKIKLWAIPEGTMVFPRIPLIRVEGKKSPLIQTSSFNSIQPTPKNTSRLLFKNIFFQIASSSFFHLQQDPLQLRNSLKPPFSHS